MVLLAVNKATIRQQLSIDLAFAERFYRSLAALLSPSLSRSTYLARDGCAGHCPGRTRPGDTGKCQHCRPTVQLAVHGGLKTLRNLQSLRELLKTSEAHNTHELARHLWGHGWPSRVIELPNDWWEQTSELESGLWIVTDQQSPNTGGWCINAKARSKSKR